MGAGGGQQPPVTPALAGVVWDGVMVEPSSLEHLVYKLHEVVGELHTSTICLGFGDESLIDVKHTIKRLRAPFGCNRCADRGAKLMGLVTGPSYVARQCICNFHNAMCNRHAKKQPLQEHDFCASLKWFDAIMPEVVDRYETEVSKWLWAWWLKWTKTKRQAIEESIRVDFLCEDSVKSFVKREGAHNALKKARAIQGYRTLSTQADSAILVTAAQKAFAYVLDGTHIISGISVTFASGMNALQLGAWMQRAVDRGSTHYFERDGKNWDASMNAHHHALKQHLYKRCSADLARKMEAAFAVRGGHTSKGNYRASMSYALTGTTKSGHNDTTLGNSIVNAGVALEGMLALGLRGDIIVAGDDLLTAVQGDFDADALAQVERRFGIDPEYAKFKHWQDVSFISGVWYDHEDGIFFGPKIGRLLKRLFWTTKVVAVKRESAWRHAVVSGLWPLCKAIPILRAWLLANDGVEGYVPRASLGKDFWRFATDMKPSAATESHVLRRYGICSSQLLELEARIMRYAGKKGVLSDPLLEHIAQADNADVDVRGSWY